MNSKNEIETLTHLIDDERKVSEDLRRTLRSLESDHLEDVERLKYEKRSTS